MNESKLSKFGYNFQIKTIACFITRSNFFEQICDILDEKYYESDALKWIIGECKKYFFEYKKIITFDIFKIKVSEIENDILKSTVVDTLRETLKYINSPDLDFVQDKILDFFKNQTLKNAIVESVEVLENGNDFEKIKKIIDDAMSAGTEKDIGHEYFIDVEERYKNMARDVCETPWEIINELMQGGLGKGELGVIVAASGIGKSWVLATIGAQALKRDKTVVHYTLELNEEYVGLRYDSIFSGITNQNLKYYKEDIIKKLETIDGELIIKYFPTKTASIHTLLAHLQKTKTFGKKIDLIIVDYGDVIKDIRYAKEVRHQLGNVYEDLRGLAGEMQVPIWTASQASRASLDDDVIEAQRVSESYQKVMTADFVMSLSRKIEDKVANTGRFHVIKNRFGPDGLTYPAKMNTNIGQIEVYDSMSVGGQEQQKKIENRDNIARKLLANKYKDLIEGN
jgi:hypothetical protein